MKFHQIPWTDFEQGKPAVDPIGGRIFVNSRYQVSIRGIFTHPTDSYFGRFVELSIKRRDKERILDWRDMQKIKNVLLGEHWTMIQVFPPEKYLVDTSNQYYFYAFWERELPFGFKERMVSDQSGIQAHWDQDHPGLNKQHPFEPHQLPNEETQNQDRERFEREWGLFQTTDWNEVTKTLRRKHDDA